MPSIVQDLIVTPLWMALVWAVHALVVMLEWCFTIDLLDGGTAVGVGRGLREMQAAFTEPWLPIVLAAASVLALYHGLIRRRVADTLGEALLMGAMMVAGIWVITDPTGTVGALGRMGQRGEPGHPRGRQPRDPGGGGRCARDEPRDCLLQLRSKRPGATWSSGTSPGVVNRRGLIRACVRPG